MIRTRLSLPRFYPISDRALAGGLSHARIAREVAAAGASILQVREKDLPDGLLLREIRACVAVSGLRIIVNDRADLALAGGAAGVHLGQDDLPPEEARRLLGPEAVIGISTHSVEEAAAAEGRGVNYVALGPVYPTATKRTDRLGLGPGAVRAAAERLALPLVAIGGITLERAPELWRAGAASVAVIGDIMSSGGIRERTRAWMARAEETP